MASTQASQNRPSRSDSQLGFGDVGNPNANDYSSKNKQFQKLDDNVNLVPSQRGKITSKVGVASLSSHNSERGGSDGTSLAEDEIPLHQIRVKTETDVKWTPGTK